jgi:hypothetical protein
MANDTKKTSSRPELVRNRKRNGANAALSFPKVPFPHGFQMIFKKYDYSTFLVSNRGFVNRLPTQSTGQSVEVEQNSIELPFPRTLVDDNKLKVAEFERSFLSERLTAALSDPTRAGAKASEVAAAYTGFIRNAGEMIGQGRGGELVSGLRDTIAKAANINTDQAMALGKYLLRTFTPNVFGSVGESVGRAVDLATATVVNPNETLAFEGVNLKSFSFSWELIPSSLDDSEQLNKIIRLLKRNAFPSTRDAGFQFGERLLLNYPSVVLINLLGVNENYWMRFKPCMISGVNVTYGAGSDISILTGGKPSAVSLTIDFTELTAHSADDYADEPVQAEAKSESTPTPSPNTNVGPR